MICACMSVGKPGNGCVVDVYPRRAQDAAGQHAVGGGFDFHAHLAHFGNHGVKLLKGAVRKQQFAVGDPGGGVGGFPPRCGRA